jgi:hypothetical protein
MMTRTQSQRFMEAVDQGASNEAATAYAGANPGDVREELAGKLGQKAARSRVQQELSMMAKARRAAEEDPEAALALAAQLRTDNERERLRRMTAD